MAQHLIFVDVEARGQSPVNGTMTEFGCVHEATLETFHGQLFEGTPDPDNPAIPVVGRPLAEPHVVAQELIDWLKNLCGDGRPVFVSDNPAYDFMWIAGLFDWSMKTNPFGHSGRRISDFWAGLQGEWKETQGWKRLRVTPHDHNPVNDAMGNVEAWRQIMVTKNAGKIPAHLVGWSRGD